MSIDRSSLFINGGWVAPSTSSRVTVRNAATEDILGSAPLADVTDVDRAVAGARNGSATRSGQRHHRHDRAATSIGFRTNRKAYRE